MFTVMLARQSQGEKVGVGDGLTIPDSSWYIVVINRRGAYRG